MLTSLRCYAWNKRYFYVREMLNIFLISRFITFFDTTINLLPYLTSEFIFNFVSLQKMLLDQYRFQDLLVFSLTYFKTMHLFYIKSILRVFKTSILSSMKGVSYSWSKCDQNMSRYSKSYYKISTNFLNAFVESLFLVKTECQDVM